MKESEQIRVAPSFAHVLKEQHEAFNERSSLKKPMPLTTFTEMVTQDLDAALREALRGMRKG